MIHCFLFSSLRLSKPFDLMTTPIQQSALATLGNLGFACYLPWACMTFANMFITFFPTDFMQLISINRLLIIVYENIDFMLS